MQEQDLAGAQVARIRKQRGMTQVALAKRANVSVSMISKLEKGHASASSQMLGTLAEALGVDATVLSGPQDEPGQLNELVPSIRRALASVDLFATDDPPAPLKSLRAQVAELNRWRRDTKYRKIGRALPELVEQLLLAGREYGEPAYALLADAYRASNTLAHKLGYADLSLTAMDRMEWAAGRSGDPLLLATTHYLRAAALARIGAGKQAMMLLDRTMTEIEPLIASDQDAAAVWTALHMRAGTISATLADGAGSREHLDEAARVAADVGNRIVYETTVGPANVQLHQIAAAVDLGQGGKAIQVARATVLPDKMATERHTHYHLDVARAHLLNRRPDDAIEELHKAHTLAPEHFRASTTVKTAIHTAGAQQRRATHGLRALANLAGIED
ncbi:helix-turn-helix domain-containing protein [Nocardia sp. NPDC059239]|uniref:helix-turn-helix domain-containing protein n=1 Tax=unclassified Nocardia TaxID=2637762 RepID=UPI0036CAE740